MKPEDYLLPIQVEKLKAFNKDPMLKDALYKVFLAPLYLQGVMIKGKEFNAPTNFALTPAFDMILKRRETWDNEKLGEWVKVQAQAIQFVEQGFGELEKFTDKPKAEGTEEENVAE